LSDHTPLFRRIDRTSLVEANRMIQDAAPAFIAQVPGAMTRAPLDPVDTIEIEQGQKNIGKKERFVCRAFAPKTSSLTGPRSNRNSNWSSD